MVDYEQVNELESTFGPAEERVIRESWQQVIDGNDSIQDQLEHCSSPESDNMFWLFRHGWLWCRTASQNSDEIWNRYREYLEAVDAPDN